MRSLMAATMIILIPVYQMAWAAESLFLLQLKDVSDRTFRPVEDVLRQSGLKYRVLPESEVFTLPSGNETTVLLPLAPSLYQTTLARLQQHIAAGGRLVMIPPDAYPKDSVLQLLKAGNLPFSGTAFATQTLPLRWKDANGAAAIKPGTAVFTFEANEKTQVLAQWGGSYPAILQSGNVGFLNWPWGQTLDPTTDLRALATLVAMPAEASARATVPAPVPAVPVLNASTQEAPAAAHTCSACGQPLPQTNPQTTPPPVVAAPTPTPVVEGTAASDEETFSFMNDFATPAEKKAMLYELDYGTYYMHMQNLAKYRSRIHDAIEMAKQLREPFSEKAAQDLLYQADRHKSDFETLYLGGRPEEGLAAFRKAELAMLEALMMSSPSPKIEGRAIWLDRGSIVNSGGPEGLRNTLRKLHEAGINIVYFETLNAGFPVYPSKYLTRNPLINGWDPLQVAVEESHKLGMELHAWVWVFAVGNKRHNPLIGKDETYPGPVLTDAGLMSEALRNPNGGFIPGSGRQHEFWVSPASPKGRQFLKDVYSEIVSKYDVDGLQLDYIRFPFQSSQHPMGYDAVTMERFKTSTGVDLSGGLDEQKRKLWTAWKTYQVSSFVKEISQTLKGIKPDLKLSAAVFPMKREQRILAIQQDWETWVENGWIDTLSPMSYTRSPELLARVSDYVKNSPRSRTLVYPGIAIDRLEAGQLLGQLEALRHGGVLGSTLFANAHLNESKAQLLGRGPYKQKPSEPPHKNPLHGASVILKDYEHKLTTLQQAGELDMMSPDDLASLQQHLSKVQHALSELQMRYGNAKSIPASAFAPIQSDFAQLLNLSRTWTNAEKDVHPFRAVYFNELMTKVELLVDYTAAHLQNAPPSTVAATSVPVKR